MMARKITAWLVVGAMLQPLCWCSAASYPASASVVRCPSKADDANAFNSDVLIATSLDRPAALDCSPGCEFDPCHFPPPPDASIGPIDTIDSLTDLDPCSPPLIASSTIAADPDLLKLVGEQLASFARHPSCNSRLASICIWLK